MIVVTLIEYSDPHVKILYIYYQDTIYSRYTKHPYNFNYKMFPWENIILSEKELEAINSEDQTIKNIIFDILELKYKTW